MMYNTRYLPENFEQCRLEKTILRHFHIILMCAYTTPQVKINSFYRICDKLGIK